ncbi:MAG: radical SAM protein, partial [Pseudonocardiaceae bacterium]
EFEEPLLAVVDALRAGVDPVAALGDTGLGDTGKVVSMGRQKFRVPDRRGLPLLSGYAFLTLPDGSRRTVGYTEATRGCKHLCRHCPVVPVYGGRFRVVQRDVVLDDIANQVDQGAEHITFGDPDFFNGPAHALALVESLHERLPQLTYDVTIKIEHLVKHRDRLPVLQETGCVLVTSAVESVDERILDFFDKRHTREEFIAVVEAFRQVGLHLNPTFVAFTPWTSLDGYLEFLSEIYRLGLVDSVAPVQYAIRLLIPQGSKLLELAHVRDLVQPFDHEALVYPWSHPDPRVDELGCDVFRLVQGCLTEGRSRAAIFGEIWRLAAERCGRPERVGEIVVPDKPNAVPQLSEPWY